MQLDDSIFVASGEAFIGPALVRWLTRAGYRRVQSSVGIDLTDAGAVEAFFVRERPRYVFLVGGESGGIKRNMVAPADLAVANLHIEVNVMGSALRHGVEKLLCLSSSCVYPKDAPQPLRPDMILTAPLEPTSEAYAVAKIAGLKLAQAYRRQYGVRFIAGIAADIFGPDDEFDPERSHVIASLMRRMHDAKATGAPIFSVWGSGKPRREFLWADDFADACRVAMEHYDGDEPINLGGGQDISIRELALLIKQVVGYDGEFTFDTSKPDGALQKLLDSRVLASLGWRASTPFDVALQTMYGSFLARSHG